MHDKILAMIVGAVFLQEPPHVRPDVGPDHEHLRYEEGFKPVSGGAYANLMISPPIGLAEWDGYAEMMPLSDAQRHALAEAYDRYRRIDWAFRMEQAQPFWQRSSLIMNSGRISTDVPTATELRDLFERAHALESRIDAIKSVLFADVEAVVSTQQSLLVEVVRMRRSRLRAQQVRSTFPCYTFDLDSVMLEMSRDGLDLTPGDQDTLDGLLST